MGAPGQPAFPQQNVHTMLWMHWPDPPFVHSWNFTRPCGTLSSAGRHLLRDGPKHCQGQEILIPVQERICRAWFYLLHSAGLILVSLCLSAMPWSALHSHPAWAHLQFTGGCASLWVTTSSLSEHRFLPLNGFYGRMSPTSLTWSFLNKRHAWHFQVGFCQLHSRSCHTPSCLPGISAWELQPEKSLLGSCGTRTECDLLTFGRDASLRCVRAAE